MVNYQPIEPFLVLNLFPSDQNNGIIRTRVVEKGGSCMTNLIERVNELEAEFKTAYSLSDSEKAKYKREIQDLAEMLEWIRDEMKSIEKGTYDDEKKKMVFKMKNKTRFSFEQFSFYLWTKDYTKIPIDIYLWRPGEEKK